MYEKLLPEIHSIQSALYGSHTTDWVERDEDQKQQGRLTERWRWHSMAIDTTALWRMFMTFYFKYIVHRIPVTLLLIVLASNGERSGWRGQASTELTWCWYSPLHTVCMTQVVPLSPLLIIKQDHHWSDEINDLSRGKQVHIGSTVLSSITISWMKSQGFKANIQGVLEAIEA